MTAGEDVLGLVGQAAALLLEAPPLAVLDRVDAKRRGYARVDVVGVCGRMPVRR